MRRFVTLLVGLCLLVQPATLYAQDAPADPPPDDAPPASLPDVTDATQQFREHVIQLTNAERTAQSLPSLTENPELTLAAQAHAAWMASSSCFAHVCPGELEFDNRITQAGYSWNWVAENIAAGYPTPEQVLTGWMNSPGHRANILNPNLQEIGVGVIQDGPRPYWVQDFGAAS